MFWKAYRDKFKDTNVDTWLITEKDGEKVKWNGKLPQKLKRFEIESKNQKLYGNSKF